MAWVKANGAIVALCAVIVVVLPVSYIGSSMWNKRIRGSRENEVNKAMLDLNALRISYVLPAALPGGTATTQVLDAPNQRMTEFFREHRKKLEEQVVQVVEAAQRVNQADHRPLIDGLFPQPANRHKTLDLAEALVGKEGRPSAYETLLKSINAGGPADPVQLQSALDEYRMQRIENVQQLTNRENLTEQEQAELRRELGTLRLGYYQRRAQEISVYAGPESLPADIPKAIPSPPPTVDTCFVWQFDYWMIADLLRAIDNANTIDGQRVGVERALVKRIESMKLDPLIPARTVQQTESPDGPPPGPRNRLTGRGGNPLYDVRNADLTLLVSSARLGELINAFSRTNFMTVIGLEFEDVDSWAHLEDGYYYGPDHVVRVRITVETVWLRNWTTPLMPPAIRRALTGSDGTEDGGLG
jgi:hypothetical protein